MKRFFCHLLPMLLATAGGLFALPEEDPEGRTGEQEELPEWIPEHPIPWHDSLLELPWWMPQEQTELEARTRPSNHGGGLFPPQVWPLQPEPEQGPLLWDAAMARAGPRVEELPPGEPVPLDPAVLSLYTAQLPERVFVDPQHLVEERSAGQMESLVQRWLNDQCVFRTTVLVFGTGQQLPADLDPQALRRHWFGGSEEALLVFYFYRQPERTLAIFGPAARSAYTEGVLRSVVDAAVTEAGRVPGGAGQLERFCYKMSVRLHWLARARLSGGEAAAASGAARSGRSPGATLALKGGGIALLTGAGAALAWWYRRQRQMVPAGDGPILFPEWESCPRLGAPHSGGFSSVITFPRNPPRS